MTVTEIKKMIFWGATGQAKVLHECLRPTGLSLIALFDNAEQVASPFPDVPIYTGKQGFENWLKESASNEPIGFLVAIGGKRGKDRVEIQEYLESHGLIALTAIHRTAFVPDNAEIGSGSQILAQAAVGIETRIGRGCIVNTSASVDHECRLEDGVHICPGAHLAGCVTVERYAMIGTGASVVPRITIGTGAVIGAGAVVLHDIPPYSVAVGNPARVIREIENVS